MSFKIGRNIRATLLISMTVTLIALSTRLQADTGTCGGQAITLPFTDVPSTNLFFCSIVEAYFSALTNGTTATTYNPTDPVTREQMAAFITRTLDQALKRGSSRAALGQWWNANDALYGEVGSSGGLNPQFLTCDGLSVWASNTTTNNIGRVDIRTGLFVCQITNIPQPEKIVIVSGRVYIASFQLPGKIYSTSLTQTTSVDAFTTFTGLGSNPVGITCDGGNLWTANFGTGPGTGSISRVSLRALPNADTTTFTTGYNQPKGILFDGANLWVTDLGDGSLKKVNPGTGAVIQTISLSGTVGHPVFDGTNLWIPCSGPDKVYVVRGVGGLTGTILAQLTGNGLNGADQAAFDGERICVPNVLTQTVSLWKASDLSPIDSIPIALVSSDFNPRGICSDGTSFYIGLKSSIGETGLVRRF